jgi:hypothetical protein
MKRIAHILAVGFTITELVMCIRPVSASGKGSYAECI